jgi:hypothetical protein
MGKITGKRKGMMAKIKTSTKTITVPAAIIA